MSAVLEPETLQATRPKRVSGWHMLHIIRNIRRGNFGPALKNAYTQGDDFESRLGYGRVIFLLRPEVIEAMLVKNHKSYEKDAGFRGLKKVLGNGILTSEGSFHLRQRRLIQPAFHKKRIDGYADAMVRITRERAAHWKDGARLDFHAEMMITTLAIIAKTMFNADVSEDAVRVADALEKIIQVQDRYIIPWVGRILDALPLASTRDLEQALRELDTIIYRYIAEHRATVGDSGDLLDMLLQSRYEDDGSGMPDELLRDECLTLFLAGHETTAVALSWTWYLLAQHPEIEARMHAEIDRVLGGRAATAGDVEQLEFTRKIFTESMRLYPPAYAFGRQAIEDNDLGPYKIRKGDTLIVSQYISHRQHEWFPEPEKFDPDRWGRPETEELPKFAYYPFGGGARKCIGENFAWMEGILLLATIAQEWQPRLAAGHNAGMDPQVTLRPRNGMPMLLTRRNAR